MYTYLEVGGKRHWEEFSSGCFIFPVQQEARSSALGNREEVLEV